MLPSRMSMALASAWIACLSLASAEPQPPAANKGWAFTAPGHPIPPPVSDSGWVRNDVDRFVLATLEAKGLRPNPSADSLTLLRRVTFDLTGLPPTEEEQEAFLADQSSDAYERVVDRLLASPRHGERWAQHWLDLVRYAETDGFKSDDLRPHAHKYRDYVIQAFNDDLAYDRFIRQQLAGDELEPEHPLAVVATGFNRLWPDENNAANLEQRRQEILDDVTDVTGLAFLGLTVGCARCHDHKYDPILQTDYFRLQAFFAAMQPRDELASNDPRQRDREAKWEEATKELRSRMDDLLAGKRTEMRKNALGKFRPEIQDAVLALPEKRTPYQQQIAWMAEQQVQRAEAEAAAKLPADKKKQFQELEKQMATMASLKPLPPASVMALTDVGRAAPPTHLLAGGDWRKPGEALQPGFPLVLGEGTPDARIDSAIASTGRRAALARWLTQSDHPLTARVMVNRLWQHHFGVGIVATPSDFGSQGAAPTHPALLDWLASEFVRHGWSLKHVHRLMVASATYRQKSDVRSGEHAKARQVDPENRLLWHARRRRLEGEALRDAALLVSGELNERMFGPSAKPKLPANVSKYAWKPDARLEDQHRRSIYVLAKRNMRYPLFEAFDQPDLHLSCARRNQTTTAPQALLLFNGDFLQDRAQAWANCLTRSRADDLAGLIGQAYRTAYGRVAQPDEVEAGVRFLREHESRLAREMVADPPRAALVDFCHALLNSNEFLHVD